MIGKKRGQTTDNYSQSCCFRGWKISKKLVKLISVTVLCLILPAMSLGISLDRNLVINSPSEITPSLINKIVNNSIDSLTINYAFTYCPDQESLKLWEEQMNRINPFWIANQVNPVKRIEFEIKLPSQVNSLDCAFYNFVDLEYVNLKDTSHVTSMKWMFRGAKSFNQPIGKWDTSKVTNMNGMFMNAESFNQPIGDWDNSQVTTMSDMFYYATSFNQPISNWNTSQVTDMGFMFNAAKSFNQPIGNWDTSKVTDMTLMFFRAESFNQPIGNWNTSSVKSMSGMFMKAKSFNQPVGNWDTTNVTTMKYMFHEATSYSHAKPQGADSEE